MKKLQTLLPTLDTTEQLAHQLADLSPDACVFYLRGPLGVGKTTFAQFFIRHCGYQQRIKSPSFSLLELYSTAKGDICHLDCYRIQAPEELEYLGLRDHQATPHRWLIEWPEQGEGNLPHADITLQFSRVNRQHSVELIAHTVKGEHLLNALPSH